MVTRNISSFPVEIGGVRALPAKPAERWFISQGPVADAAVWIIGTVMIAGNARGSAKKVLESTLLNTVPWGEKGLPVRYVVY